MMSLFSSFDLIYFNIGLFLFSLLIINFIYFTFGFNLMKSSIEMFFTFLMKFFYSLKPSSFSKFSLTLIVSLMTMILFLNFYSILPFNFPVTSQISVVFYLSLMIWGSLIVFNMINSSKEFMSHCIPEGTPIYLTWFLFAIELMSNLIRPLTLTVRLTANILAGHLLMSLLSQLALNSSYMWGLYSILNMVEIAVSFIQSYIFVTMICLYYSEI